eukprot:249378_1
MRCVSYTKIWMSNQIHRRVHHSFVLPLSKQRKVDCWQLFSLSREYQINLKYQYRHSAVTRYATTTSVKLIHDLDLCNRFHIALRDCSMEKPERVNKYDKKIQKQFSANWKGIKTEISNISTTLMRPIKISEFQTFSTLDLLNVFGEIKPMFDEWMDGDDCADFDFNVASGSLVNPFTIPCGCKFAMIAIKPKMKEIGRAH